MTQYNKNEWISGFSYALSAYILVLGTLMGVALYQQNQRINKEQRITASGLEVSLTQPLVAKGN